MIRNVLCTKSSADKTYRVRVPNEAEFALSLLHNKIYDCSDDTPAIGEIDIHLNGKVSGLVPLGSKDDVLVVVLRACSRNVSANLAISLL